MNQGNNVSAGLTNSNNVYQQAGDLPLLDRQSNRAIPNIDFSDPANFVKFGSATQYYKNCIEYINTTYPYDGTKSEKLTWENALSDFEYYVFAKEYPKYVGYVGIVSGSYLEASTNTLQDQQIEPGQGLDPFSYETNIDLEEGFTLELWFKSEEESPELSIFKLSGPVIVNAQTGEYAERELINIYVKNGQINITNGATNPVVQIPGSIAISNWHHYAFSITPVAGDDGLAVIKVYIDGDLIYDETTEFMVAIAGRHFVPLGLLWVPLKKLIPINITEEIKSTYRFGGKDAMFLDEIRLWKKVRTDEEIKLFWFTSVDGT